ncbi:MAG: type IV pilus twitching motility protein PilT [Chitinispirillales bacterium]|jgi:twitching motility protein PilT|nr:type IV pilus twitching motility protein PilT [Chitinispirillales bacterium]
MPNKIEHIRDLFQVATECGASDMIICVGQPPMIRVDGQLVPLDFEVLVPERSKELCYQIMTESQQKALEDNWETDFSFGLRELSRFRANVFMQRGAVSAAFRRIPMNIKTFDELNLPPIVQEMCEKPNGLILVTGPTGSGKSTTLAAMIDHINASRQQHIITIEDPIEYIHRHKSCTIEQREIYSDTKSFHAALKSVLRQDPDVVLLGEMRDQESIQAALTISETGHLCMATLHTNSCSQTLSRIVDVFPEGKQQQVRTQLAMSLNAVLTQMLLPKIGGGVKLIMEIMIGTSAIKALIRENKIHNIDNVIQTGSKWGMQSMNNALAEAVFDQDITEEDAFFASSDHDDLRMCLSRRDGF